MAGIPEHLLKRAQERRDALAGKTAESGDASAASANVPAKTTENKPTASAPVVSSPPPPPPDPAYVVAAKSRKKSRFGRWPL